MQLLVLDWEEVGVFLQSLTCDLRARVKDNMPNAKRCLYSVSLKDDPELPTCRRIHVIMKLQENVSHEAFTSKVRDGKSGVVGTKVDMDTATDTPGIDRKLVQSSFQHCVRERHVLVVAVMFDGMSCELSNTFSKAEG